MSLIDALDRVARDRPERGITIVDARGRNAERRSWEQVRDGAIGTASRLSAAGLAPGDRLLICLPTSWDWLDTWLGAVFAGAIPAATAAPGTMGSSEGYSARVARLAGRIGARNVVASTAVRDELAADGEAGIAAGVLPPDELRAVAPASGFRVAPAAPESTAFLQFTSGSTGLPRAVAISHRAVLHNNAASDEAIGAPWGGPASEWASAMVSWLPLHHDMGLVGCLFMAVTSRLDLTMLHPATFLARPRLWLERLAAAGPTFAPAPNFGYQLCVERLADDQFEGLDLSRWRAALTGAEMVRPETVAAFCDRAARTGFQPTSFRPCYGMAETTLAATFDLRGQGLRTRPLPAGAGAGLGLCEVASVGSPVRDTRVCIVDPGGGKLPDGAVGEVRISGPGLFDGYFGDDEATRETLVDGWMRTGDLGFLAAGELYLTGRIKDVLIIKGNNVMPHELEWLAESVAGGGGAARCGAFSVARGADGEQAVLVLETTERDPERRRDLEREVRTRIGRALALPLADVVFVRRGKIPRTTSGKVRRQELRQLYLDQRIEREGV